MANEKFEGLFSDAIEGLIEYHGRLLIPLFVQGIKKDAEKTYSATGNDLNDYENMRDFIEKRIQNDDFVRMTIKDVEDEKTLIRDALGAIYKGKLNGEEASKIIGKFVNGYDMAEFIVDAFNRGWISNFNLGLNDDGNPI